MLSLRKIPPEYRFTAVRSRLERKKLFIDPQCPHAIEVMEKHQYHESGKGWADKVTRYSKSYHRESKKIQLVHLADSIGYGIYKLWPAQVNYEKLERAA